MTDLLLHNARLLDPARAFDSIGFVAIRDGVITKAGPGQAGEALLKSATTAIDCGGACLAPGLIDMQTADLAPSTLRSSDAARCGGRRHHQCRGASGCKTGDRRCQHD